MIYKVIVVGKNKIYSMTFGREEVKELRSSFFGRIILTSSRTIIGVYWGSDNASRVKYSKNDGL